MDLGDDADQRHPDDPGGRRPGERVRDDARACAPAALHAAVAAIPAASSVAIPAHIGTCASREQRERRRGRARDRAEGEERASHAEERARREPDERATRRGARRPRRAARRRSEAARPAAIETPKSSATSLRIGDSTSTPDWLANSARKSTSDGDGRTPNRLARAGVDGTRTGTASDMPEAFVARAGSAMRRARVAHAGNRTLPTTLGRRDLLPGHAPRRGPGVPLRHAHQRRRRQRRHLPQAARARGRRPTGVFVLESAGNLATTQEVLDRIDRDLAAPGEHESLATVDAPLRGGALRRPARPRGRASGTREALGGRTATATFILGGQIGERRPTSCSSTPRATTSAPPTSGRSCRSARASTASSCSSSRSTPTSTCVTATKIALGSMMSTARANLSVGPPYDLGVYRNGVFDARRAPRSRPTRPSSTSSARCGSGTSCARSRSCPTSRWPSCRTRRLRPGSPARRAPHTCPTESTPSYRGESCHCPNATTGVRRLCLMH